MRTSFFLPSSLKPQTPNQRKNTTPTFQGGKTEYSAYPTTPNNDRDVFLLGDQDSYFDEAMRELSEPAAYFNPFEKPQTVSSKEEDNSSIPSHSSSPKVTADNEEIKIAPSQFSLHSNWPDLDPLAEDHSHSGTINPFKMHYETPSHANSPSPSTDIEFQSPFTYTNSPSPSTDSTDTDEVDSQTEEPQVKVPQPGLTDPKARWDQLSKQGRATLLTILAEPRHLRLRTKVVQAFLRNQYDYQVSKSAIQSGQKLLENAGAQDVHSLKQWSLEEEQEQEQINRGVLQDVFNSQGLHEIHSLIPFDNQALYGHKTDSSSNLDSGDDKMDTESSPSSRGASRKKRKRDQTSIEAPSANSSSSTTRVKNPTATQRGRHLTDTQKLDLLNGIAAKRNITITKIKQKYKVGDNAATYYKKLMQHCNFNTNAALSLLEEIRQGSTLSTEKRRKLLTYLQENPKAEHHTILFECKVGSDTVRKYKKLLKECKGNIEQALAQSDTDETKQPKKRQKK